MPGKEEVEQACMILQKLAPDLMTLPIYAALPFETQCLFQRVHLSLEFGALYLNDKYGSMMNRDLLTRKWNKVFTVVIKIENLNSGLKYEIL